MKRLLICGDAVAETGFARVVHNLVKHLKDRFRIGVLAVNYKGDPTPLQQDAQLYPADLGGDFLGVGRFQEVLSGFQPDIVLIVNDPWNIVPFLRELPANAPIPIVAYMPVDAPNQRAASELGRLDRAIAYTKFGRRELLQGGFRGRCDVIPHGIDPAIYHPVDKLEARRRLKFRPAKSDAELEQLFIVLNVNRNQPRKRFDLTIQAWTQFWHEVGCPPEAKLHIHAGNRDIGWNIVQLAQYYGVDHQLIMTNPEMTPTYCVSEGDMPYIYSMADVFLSTTLGEGWGLTVHEAMACGIPPVVPEYSGLAEWCAGAATFVPVTGYQVTHNGINTIGGVPDVRATVDALIKLYRDPALRAKAGEVAQERALLPVYRWPAIADQFAQALTEVLEDRQARPVGVEALNHG